MTGGSAGFDAAYAAAGLGRNGKPETFTARDLMALVLPPIRWVVPGLLPEGVTLLAGKPKLGKSWLAFGVAVAVASGGAVLGTKRVERGEALYLALEDNQRRLQGRLGKLLAGGDAPEGLHIATEWPRMDEGGEEALEGWLTDHPDARLVVVDVLQRVRPSTSYRQSVYEADYRSLGALHAIAGGHGVAVLCVHHLRKAGADDPLDEISGSTGLSGAADGVMVLKRDRGRGDAYLHVDGRDIEEAAELALTWNADTACWALAGDAEQYRLSQTRAEVIEVLEKSGESMTPTEVADALGKPFNTIKQRLWHMSREGQVLANDGRYSLPNNHNPRNPRNRNPDEPVTKVTPVTHNPSESAEAERERRAWALPEGDHRPHASEDDPLEPGGESRVNKPNSRGKGEQSAQGDQGDHGSGDHRDDGGGDVPDKVAELFADPPEWLRLQAAECVRQGSPERLLNPLANAVSSHLFGSPWRWREVLPGVVEAARAHQRRRRGGDRAM